MKEMIFKIVKDLRVLADDLEAFANISEKEKKNSKVKTNQDKEKLISIEDVRAVLVSKSQAGKQKEVKALIEKYGANKLTDLDKSCYKDLFKDAEEL